MVLNRARACFARGIVGGLPATNWLERTLTQAVERGIRIAAKRVALSAEQIAELFILARRDWGERVPNVNRRRVNYKGE